MLVQHRGHAILNVYNILYLNGYNTISNHLQQLIVPFVVNNRCMLDVHDLQAMKCAVSSTSCFNSAS